jgi:hypothetical protein
MSFYWLIIPKIKYIVKYYENKKTTHEEEESIKCLATLVTNSRPDYAANIKMFRANLRGNGVIEFCESEKEANLFAQLDQSTIVIRS